VTKKNAQIFGGEVISPSSNNVLVLFTNKLYRNKNSYKPLAKIIIHDKRELKCQRIKIKDAEGSISTINFTGDGLVCRRKTKINT